MVHMMKQNGGVYEEMAEMVRTFINATRVNPNYQRAFVEAANAFLPDLPPFDPNSASHVMNLFEQEVGREFSSIFRKLSPIPIERGDLVSHSAVLRSGQPVTITIMRPHVKRMRTMDLIPFRAFNWLFQKIPGLSHEQKVAQVLMDRLTFSIEKEIDSRSRVLKSYGVDVMEYEPTDLIRKARDISPYLHVPTPLPSLCGQHIMVSDVEGDVIMPMSASSAWTLIEATSELAFVKNCVIADLGRPNVRKFGSKISFRRFSSLIEFDPVYLTGALQFCAGFGMKWNSLMRTGGELLGCDPAMVENTIATKKLEVGIVRQMVGKNAGFIVGFGEAACGLANASIDAGAGLGGLAGMVSGFAGKFLGPDYSHRSWLVSWLGWLRYLPF
jgi:hypothetical protein